MCWSERRYAADINKYLVGEEEEGGTKEATRERETVKNTQTRRDDGLTDDFRLGRRGTNNGDSEGQTRRGDGTTDGFRLGRPLETARSSCPRGARLFFASARACVCIIGSLSRRAPNHLWQTTAYSGRSVCWICTHGVWLVGEPDIGRSEIERLSDVVISSLIWLWQPRTELLKTFPVQS